MTKILLETLKKAITAGLMIGIGATVYLSCESKLAGAMLFSIGLFTICYFGLNLFTGKIGYVIDTKNNPNCIIIWLGNLIGCGVTALLIRTAKPALAETAVKLVETKLSQNIFAVMILSVFCGMLMYIAVENYKNNATPIGKQIGILLCVTVFILCGFEHSVANMFYCILGITADNALRSLLFILLVSVFNGVGAVIFRELTKERENKQ